MALTAQLVRDDRRADREALDVDGTLRGVENTPTDVVVEDLSATGFRIRTHAGLNLGETVSIGIPGIGRRQAEVIRRTEGGFGCAFVEPIDPRLVAAPLTAQPVVTGDFGGLDVEAVRRWSLDNPPHVEPLSRGQRILVLGGLGVVGWLAVLGIASLL
jgi:hypothetical protein